MSNKLKIIIPFVVTVAVLVLFTWLAQRDQEYSSLAQRWVNDIEKDLNTDSEAYLYLNGIMAAESDDVLSVGKARHEVYRQAFAEHDYSLGSDLNKFEAYPAEKRLALPNLNGMLCIVRDYQCFHEFTAQTNTWKSKLNENAELFRRYQHFIAYEEYTSIAESSFLLEFVPYEYISKGNQLLVLQAFILAETGNIDRSVAILRQDIRNVRRLFAEVDSLELKVHLASVLMSDLVYLSFLIQRYDVASIEYIEPLTSEELSIRQAIIREFSLFDTLFKATGNASNLFSEEVLTPLFVVRVLFKSKKSSNELAMLLEQYIELSEMPQAAFAASNFVSMSKYASQLDFNNFLGRPLVLAVTTDYSPYVNRLFTINSYISMLNYLSNQQPLPINPFFPKEQAYTIDADKVCLKNTKYARPDDICFVRL